MIDFNGMLRVVLYQELRESRSLYDRIVLLYLKLAL